MDLLSTLPKATEFDLIKTEHPKGKKDVKGNMVMVTGYKLGDTVHSSNEVISCKVDGDVYRWLKYDLDSKQIDTIKTIKGKATFTKIALVAFDLRKRLINASKNGGINRQEVDVAKLLDFVSEQVGEGVDALIGKTKSEPNVPEF
jgi:hypothetical protein